MAVNSVDLGDNGTSKLLENQDGGLIIHMLKKEPIDEQKYEEFKKAEYAQQNNRYETIAVREWLKSNNKGPGARRSSAGERPGRSVLSSERSAASIDQVSQRNEWRKSRRKSKNSLTMPTATWQLVNYRPQSRSIADASNKFQEFFDGWHALGMALMKHGNFRKPSRQAKERWNFGQTINLRGRVFRSSTFAIARSKKPKLPG